mmetsp:Transcript_39946/g.105555  ORF Transcript_39946/g.105555 Transcript_39946/m.105555 type:complete len:320 (+) Transcript_39946:23-982(+)
MSCVQNTVFLTGYQYCDNSFKGLEYARAIPNAAISIRTRPTGISPGVHFKSSTSAFRSTLLHACLLRNPHERCARAEGAHTHRPSSVCCQSVIRHSFLIPSCYMHERENGLSHTGAQKVHARACASQYQLKRDTTWHFACSATPNISRLGLGLLFVLAFQPYSCDVRGGARYFSVGSRPAVRQASPRVWNMCVRMSRASSRPLTPEVSVSTSGMPVYAPFALHGFVSSGTLVVHLRFDIVLRACCSLSAAAMPSAESSLTRTEETVHLVPPNAYLAVACEKPRGGGSGLLARKLQLLCHSAAPRVSSSSRCFQIVSSWT